MQWLQGIAAYVDSRGFAGVLSHRENVFEWSRDVDLQPLGEFPDAGYVRWWRRRVGNRFGWACGDRW